MVIDNAVILFVITIQTAVFLYLFNKLDNKIDKLDTKIENIQSTINHRIDELYRLVLTAITKEKEYSNK